MTDRAAAVPALSVVPPSPVPHPALALLAVVPLEAGGAERWEAADPRRGVRLVPHRDVAALVMPVAPGLPASDPEALVARHEEVHRALLRGSVVPAPLGVAFGGAAEVERFLAEAYGTLRSALARVEGRWELRLHADLVDTALAEPLAMDLVTHIYAELRRISASAIPFARHGRRLLSAAFLVERASSAGFQDRVGELARINSALALDLTGPWPPYDFVQMHG